MIASIPLPPLKSHWLPRLLAMICLAVAACSSSPAAPVASLRIMIQFRTAVDGAEPSLLSRLQRRSGVSIRHAASVTHTLHAYVLACPAVDPHCETAIRELRKDADILDVFPDQLRKPLLPSP